MCIAAGSFTATKQGAVVPVAGPSEQVLAKKLLDLVRAAGAAEAAGRVEYIVMHQQLHCLLTN